MRDIPLIVKQNNQLKGKLELYSMEGVAVEKNDNSSSNNTPGSDLTNHCPPFEKLLDIVNYLIRPSN